MKNAFKKFRDWSVNYWWVYSIASFPPWTLMYQTFFRKNYSISIALFLLGVQFIGLVMLMITCAFVVEDMRHSR